MQQKSASFLASMKDWLKISGFVFIFSGFWMFMPPMLVMFAIYLCYVKLLVFGPFVAIYLTWFYYSKDWPECGCMPTDLTRINAFYLRWGCEYFNYRVVKTADLPLDKNYIVGSHPHGMTCLGMTFSLGAQMPNMKQLYEGLKTWTVTLAGQFDWPLRRELLLWGACGSASKRNLQWILRREEKGHAVAVALGGLNEALMAAPGKYHLKLKDRKGFVKLALTEGADLVPMFHFGENEMYEPVVGICPKRMRNVQAHLMNTFGFCPPFHMGRSLLGLPWGGFVPMQTRLESVIGDTIRVEKNLNPSQEEIDKLHVAYCNKLIELFEQHKANYGLKPEQKIIIY